MRWNCVHNKCWYNNDLVLQFGDSLAIAQWRLVFTGSNEYSQAYKIYVINLSFPFTQKLNSSTEFLFNRNYQCFHIHIYGIRSYNTRTPYYFHTSCDCTCLKVIWQDVHCINWQLVWGNGIFNHYYILIFFVIVLYIEVYICSV